MRFFLVESVFILFELVVMVVGKLCECWLVLVHLLVVVVGKLWE